MQINAPKLTAFVTQIFVETGANPSFAREVGEHLVAANLKGHDSHGVGMVPAYVRNIGAGLLQQDAQALVVKDNGAVMVVDGQFGFGQVVGRQAADIAMQRVREIGVVCMGVRNCHHLGRIGTYAEHCVEQGFISLHMVNVVGHEPLVSPFAGRQRRLSTNPFCCAVPHTSGKPIILDMATSAVAMGKVRVAYNAGEQVAAGALVDHEGTATTDPAVMYEAPLGALGPFGLHKGYGLAVMCELLGGALAGEWTAQPENLRSHHIVNNMFMLVLDPQAFGGLEKFQYEVNAMVDYLHSTAPAKGAQGVMLPGEPERESMAKRLVDGIPIDNKTWASLIKAAATAGLDEKEIETLTL
ncbi:MAG: malate/lactate/ureidoglycolate dehydrogenase [Gammaproteobacteria bacterium]|nr:malate/lactate/ureidoglycolate dehydrogenase [Gammaproteobacteria bacterium]